MPEQDSFIKQYSIPLLIIAVLGGIAYLGYAVNGLKGNNPGSSISTDLDSSFKRFIMDNPELIIESVNQYQQRKSVEQAEQLSKNIPAKSKELYENANDPVLGNPQGSITVVEFFDYSCGFCKRALPTIQKVIDSNPDVRVVLKEYPILGPNSMTAAVASLAVNRIASDKYLAFHQKLMEGGTKNKSKLLEIASELGINKDALTQEMANPEIERVINETRQLAQELGIRGTPAFIIGTELIPGAVDYNTLQDKIKALN